MLHTRFKAESPVLKVGSCHGTQLKVTGLSALSRKPNLDKLGARPALFLFPVVQSLLTVLLGCSSSSLRPAPCTPPPPLRALCVKSFLLNLNSPCTVSRIATSHPYTDQTQEAPCRTVSKVNLSPSPVATRASAAPSPNASPSTAPTSPSATAP